MRVLGVDEAGRGCVLGALYVAGFLADGVSDDALRAAGAADSKTVKAPRRVAAREALSRLGDARVIAIPAADIDAGNLNHLEEDAIVALISDLRPDEVVIDALGHPSTLPKVVARLRARCPGPKVWTMTPKADARFPVVGAASMFAKTERDAALAALAAAHGALGSGYPSDPVTRRWLAERAREGRFPAFVRTRWGTVRDLTAAALF